MSRELKDIIELLTNVTDAFTAALFLFDETKQELHLTAFHTLSKNFDQNAVLAPGDGLAGWVAKHGRPLSVPRFDRDTASLCFYRKDENIKSFLAVPVGQAGVLCVDSKQTYVFTDKDQKILEDFARVILHLLRAGRVRTREKDYARMLRLFHQIDQASQEFDGPDQFMERVLDELKRFAKADVVFFTSPDQDHKRYRVEALEGMLGPNFLGTSYPLDSGLVGWVYREQRPLVLRRVRAGDKKSYVFSPDDPIKRFQSFLGLPLAVWETNVGVLGLTAFEARDWSADEVAILSMTGRWVTSALRAWRAGGGG